MTKCLGLLFVLSLPSFCGDWNPRLAADYLDWRQKEWFAWPVANTRGTPCLSCHSGVTYLMARPALRKRLGESAPTQYETGWRDALVARVGKKTVKDLYVDAKEPVASQGAGVEAILAALFLAPEGSPASEQAFDRMWSMQIRDGKSKGSWQWYSLDLDPWEMPESSFYGASLAAMAVGSAPKEYRQRPDVRERVAELTAYLQRELDAQPLHNRLAALLASAKLPEAVAKSKRKAIVDEGALRKQQPDGGWTIEALGPFKEHAPVPAALGSNAYATGLTAWTLERAGVTASDARLARALAWLRSHQDPQSGWWDASSMNKVYKEGSMQVRFMRDAATAYATLALLQGE